MFVANDKDGCRVWAGEADKGEEYFCPACNAPLIYRDGPLNAPHFAHKANACSDPWNYDMSEWHREMQELFPKEKREVVVQANGKIHRADILVGKTVIEFQHSPISQTEFQDRNDFFRRLGYRIAWVFDAQEPMDSKRLVYMDLGNPYMKRWENPPRIFEACPRLSDSSTDFALWLSYRPDDDEPCYFQRVVWTATTELGKPSLRRFAVASNDIDATPDINVNHFFFSKYDFRREAEEELRKLAPYSIKVRGEKGHSKNEYMCPKNNTFGVGYGSSNECQYCLHCGLIVEKRRQGRSASFYYCCYPKKTEERDTWDYDCAPQHLEI